MTRVQPGLLARRLAAIRRGLRQGRTLTAIGHELGLTRERVRQLCAENGIPSPGHRRLPEPTRQGLLERLVARGARGRALAEAALLAERRGYHVEITETYRGGAAVYVEGLRVYAHGYGVFTRANVRHAGYHRAQWKLSRLPALALVSWPDGFEMSIVTDPGWQFRYRRIDGRTPLLDWPTPAEMRAAAVRMRRAA